MRETPLDDAKAMLSAIVDAAMGGEAFTITRHGRRDAVLVSWETCQRLSSVPSFGRLLAASPLEEEDRPDRHARPTREPIGDLSRRHQRGIGTGAGGTADLARWRDAVSAHGLILLTRNIRHFVPFGIAVANPFDGLPPRPLSNAPVSGPA